MLFHRRLQDLDNFRFINIRYSIPKDADENAHQLDCEILLTPSTRQDYKLEAEGTNSGGNIGVSGNIGYRNKNLTYHHFSK